MLRTTSIYLRARDIAFLNFRSPSSNVYPYTTMYKYYYLKICFYSPEISTFAIPFLSKMLIFL